MASRWEVNLRFYHSAEIRTFGSNCTHRQPPPTSSYSEVSSWPDPLDGTRIFFSGVSAMLCKSLFATVVFLFLLPTLTPSFAFPRKTQRMVGSVHATHGRMPLLFEVNH